MEDFKIDISVPTKEFKTHLEIEGNKRIFFSGKFGIGKTYFLNDFFGSKENQKKYLCVKLSPINYPVAQNEDIFQYIKYDIIDYLNHQYNIIEVLGQSYEDDKISLLQKNIFRAIQIKPKHFFKPLLLGLKQKHLVEAYESFIELTSEIEKNIKTLENFENIDEAKEFQEKTKESYLYEYDEISIFITEVLELLKELGASEENPKQKVLMIDDLDRLDPEHIFRLFNIFSVHFDPRQEQENKFGFDKIIFCGDMQNIRTIFHHKYGQDTDFSGYIDKFYSLHPFQFDNREGLKNEIRKIINKIEFEQKEYREYLDNRYLIEMFNFLIESNIISLRSLLSLNNYKLILNKKRQIKSHDEALTDKATLLFTLLKHVFGDTKTVKKIVETKLIPFLEINTNEQLIGFFLRITLPIVSYQEEVIKVKEENRQHKRHDMTYKFTIKIEYMPYSRNLMFYIVGNIETSSNISQKNKNGYIGKLLMETIEILERNQCLE